MKESTPAPSNWQLRVAHVWRDEVMDDTVLVEPGAVTLGTDERATFTIPDVGLPETFAILRPGSRGYVLTLGAGMDGRVKLGDEEIDVARFVQRGGSDRAEGAAGSFRATPVGPGDWGVIELDDRGDHTLFFQFVADEGPLAKKHTHEWELLIPALAFAIVLHSAFLVLSYTMKDDQHSLVFPGSRELMTNYLVKRPAPPPPPAPGPESAVAADEEEESVEPTPTRGTEGEMGGEGKERSAGPKPEGPEVDEDIEVALLDEEARGTYRRVGGGDPDMPDVLDRVNRRLSRTQMVGDRGAGEGDGGGVGPGSGGDGTSTRGDGSGGGGRNDRDVVGDGKDLDTGGNRRGPGGPGGGTGGKGLKERAVSKLGSPSGKFSGLSKEEINRVIRSASGGIRACYQAQLNRNPKLSGTVVVNFRIRGNGKVSRARVVGSKSSLRNAMVESCITRKIERLRFPAKGGAVVNYPFFFSAG